jgi:hypothetical protein
MPDPITLVATSFEDTLDVPLGFVRNQAWNPVFTITDCTGNTFDLSGYALALSVAPLNFDGSVGAAIWTCTSFQILANGSAQFAVPGTDTGELGTSGFYKWFLQSTAPGAPGPDMVLAGPLNIFDAPQPAPAPH